jgi:elongation factor Ts
MEVDAKKIKDLRNRTGAPILDCREALQATESNIEKAIVYLREKGIASAEHKKHRATLEGKIVSYVHPGDKIGVLLEINCETDFVARSEQFRSFTKDLAMHIAAANPKYLRREDIPERVLEEERQIYRTQAQNMGKPEKVIEKIVNGKLEKFYCEVCFLEQTFVRDDKISIQELIKSVIANFKENITVNRFARFQLGEGS